MKGQSLEKIVASLELCKLIPVGEFEDSALVWSITSSAYYDGDTAYCVTVCERGKAYLQKTQYTLNQDVYPAPTLEEILDAINDIKPWDFVTFSRAPGNNARHADYPLKRWLELKGIEVK